MTCIIIDDEKHCREVLQVMLSRYCPQLQVIASCESGREALQEVEKQQPDLVFLDIEMPGMNGFEWLDNCPRKDFAIIFTTAYNDYAIKAIKHSALDYLLKPIDSLELVAAVNKATGEKAFKTEAKVSQLLEAMQEKKPNKRFAVPSMEGLILINTEDIEYVQSDGAYSHFYFTNKKHLLISKTLKEAEDVLPVSDFFRIHNSYLVNLKYVQKYIRGEGGEVLMLNGQMIPVSRTKKQEFLALLERI
jgi:two-component system LytT family response regulator